MIGDHSRGLRASYGAKFRAYRHFLFGADFRCGDSVLTWLGKKGFIAASLLLMTSSAVWPHGILEFGEEADALFEAQNPDPGDLTEEEQNKRAQDKILFGLAQLNEHLNTDWAGDELLDSYLNLVAECPLPPRLCEEWVSGRFVKTYQIFGEHFVTMRLLSEAVPHMETPLPHRCERVEVSYIVGIILPTETRHMVVRTEKNDAASPCFIRAVE